MDASWNASCSTKAVVGVRGAGVGFFAVVLGPATEGG